MRFTLSPDDRATLRRTADHYLMSNHPTPQRQLCTMWDLAALLTHLEEHMPLFACEECHCVENTALCNYWPRRHIEAEQLCSACDPNIQQWHGQFDRRPATGMLVDQHGHLWSKSVVEAGQLPKGYTIVGEVPPPKGKERP